MASSSEAAVLLEIAIPVAAFTGLVIVLSLLTLIARGVLEPSGSVSIVVTGRGALDVPAGETLLFALAGHGIYLRAACGGRGSCGQCRVSVTGGNSTPLPIEAPHIGPEEAAAGVRLACMVRVREPMTVSVDEEALTAQRTAAIVVSTQSIATYLKEIVLRPNQPFAFEAGDYVLVEAPPYAVDFADFDIGAEYRPTWRRNGLLRLKSKVREATTRAYSLAGPPNAFGLLTLVVRIALPPPALPAGTPPGCVSSYLFASKPGDKLNLRGPFGDFHVRDTDREIVFIGGGAGIAPLRAMILDQLSRNTQRRMSLWYGARDVGDLCYREELETMAAHNENFSCHFALSDATGESGWNGAVGFIHAVLLERYLQSHPAPESVEYYLCGPPLMSSAALTMLEQLGVPGDNVFFDDFET